MSCKTMSIDLANVPPVPIQIGVAGENSFRTITFDASKWGADYPDATYTVVYRRSDGYLYPVLVNASADAIVWSPTETDTAVSGNGQLEVRLLDGETIGKTIIMQTYVAPSLSGDESEPSTPAPDWVNDVAADADRAEAAVSHYPKIVNGVWYVWSVQDEDYVSTGIEAQGEDGVSPTVTVTAIEGGHLVTITDASGDHTFDVMDGEGGSGAVESVNGKTGVVVLDATDVGALPDDTVIPSQIGQLSDNVGLVHYNSQTLTDAQKAQARTNIGAASMSDIPSLAAYRTASAQDAIDAAQDSAIAAKYTKPSGGIPKSDLSAAVQTSLGKADTALQQHQSLAAYRTSAAQDEIDSAQNTAIAAKYTKPSGGIPDSDIASAATWNAKGTYSKPNGGIPKSDLASGVQTSLGKADSAYQKPGGGIPASDLASGVIPTVPTAEISANTAARHTHSNKTLLDTYTQTEANLADAVSKKHSHSNKTVLDGITAAKVQSWDGKGTYSKPSGGIPKTDLAQAVQTSLGKADTALQQHQSLAGYATETYVQQQIAAIPDELPAVTASDNGKFLRVVSGAWAAQVTPSAESNSFGGGA